MVQFLNIPRLPFIIFEVVNLSTLRTEDVIVMDVIPTEIIYEHSSKKFYHGASGDFNTTVDKGGNAPIKVSFSGTFGDRYISRGLKVQDGFGRLKEFILMFTKSQQVIPDKDTYGINYYDFTFHRWGTLEVDTLRIRGNAREHAKIPSYTVHMTVIGPLIESFTDDPLIRNVRLLIEAQEFVDEINSDIENFIEETPVIKELNEILVNVETLKTVLGEVGSVTSLVFDPINSIAAPSLFNIGGTAVGNVVDFAELL